MKVFGRIDGWGKLWAQVWEMLNWLTLGFIHLTFTYLVAVLYGSFALFGYLYLSFTGIFGQETGVMLNRAIYSPTAAYLLSFVAMFFIVRLGVRERKVYILRLGITFCAYFLLIYFSIIQAPSLIETRKEAIRNELGKTAEAINAYYAEAKVAMPDIDTPVPLKNAKDISAHLDMIQDIMTSDTYPVEPHGGSYKDAYIMIKHGRITLTDKHTPFGDVSYTEKAW